MSDNKRFAIDLEEMSEERILIPAGDYAVKVSKAELKHALSIKNTDAPVYWYRLDLTLDVKDEEVSKLLNQDTPKVFYSVMLSMDKETEKLSATGNPDLGALLAACDLKTKEANTMFIDAASEAATQREFNIAYFIEVANVLPGYELLAKVVQRKHGTDDSKMVNAVTKVAKV